MLHSYHYSKPVLKISQAKGLRDPECGCTFEPFGFIRTFGDECRRALPGETGVPGVLSFPHWLK